MDLSNRYPAFRYVPVREVVVYGLCRLVFPSVSSLTWHCQIRRSHVACIDSSAGYFSLVIYVFGTFESGRNPGAFQSR